MLAVQTCRKWVWATKDIRGKTLHSRNNDRRFFKIYLFKCLKILRTQLSPSSSKDTLLGTDVNNVNKYFCSIFGNKQDCMFFHMRKIKCLFCNVLALHAELEKNLLKSRNFIY